MIRHPLKNNVPLPNYLVGGWTITKSYHICRLRAKLTSLIKCCIKFSPGLEYLHSNNIVHLDLKPENIVCLDEDSFEIKLVDFGLARRLDDTQATCIMQGTPDFVSPEVGQEFIHY